MRAGAPASSGTEPGMAEAAISEAMPIMARRPFLISETRFVANCSALSLLVKPGVSQNFFCEVGGVGEGT